MTPPKKIYALLVGINEFQNFANLDGCVNDAHAMLSYLKNLDGFSLNYKLVTTQKNSDYFPTKNTIIDLFADHLGKAKNGDVALFYFAGHGVQEATNLKAFQSSESGNLIESLVCYDSQKNINDPESTSFLSDKEIRWMTKKLESNGSHVLLITDCCHSGTVSRSSKIRQGHEKRQNLSLGTPRESGMDGFARRYYQQFAFSNEISEEAFAQPSVEKVLPLAKHVHIAACRDTQVAWEDKYENGLEGGLFTIKLIEFLKNSGPNISYDDLEEQLKNYMKGRTVKVQNPQVHNNIPHLRNFTPTFLNGVAKPKKVQFTMKYSTNLGWVISYGAIHGLKQSEKKTPIYIYDHKLTLLPVKGEIIEVTPSYSIIKVFEEEEKLSEKERYFVGVAAHIQNPVNIYLNLDDSLKTKASEILTPLLEKDPLKYISFVESKEGSDYTVHADGKLLFITFTDDSNSKPVAKQIGRTGGQKEEFKVLYSYLTQIGKWELFKNLHNSDTKLNFNGLETLDKYPVEVKFFLQGEDNEFHEAEMTNERVTAHLSQTGSEGEKYRKIIIKVINHSNQDLFVSLLYMSSLFGINTEAFSSGLCLKAKKGEVKDSVLAFEGTELTLSHDDYIKDFNWEGSLDILKLIVSTEEFSTIPFKIDELEAPVIPKNMRGSLKFANRENNFISKNDWMAVNYELFIPNVQYQD